MDKIYGSHGSLSTAEDTRLHGIAHKYHSIEKIPEIGCLISKIDNSPCKIDPVEPIYEKEMNIMALPSEVIQKIAFSLDSVSYGSLRNTCKVLQDTLPSIDNMIHDLQKNDLQGELKNNYNNIIKECLFDKLGRVDRYFLNAIRCNKNKNINSLNCFWLTLNKNFTENLPFDLEGVNNQREFYNICAIYENICREIGALIKHDSSCKNIIVCHADQGSVAYDNYKDEIYCLTIKFNNIKSPFHVGVVLSSFTSLYSRLGSGEDIKTKVFLSVMALKLKEFVLENIDDKVSVEHIQKIFAPYSALLSLASFVLKALSNDITTP